MRRHMTARFWFLMTVITVIVFAVSFGVLQLRYSQGRRQLEEVTERHKALYLQVNDLKEELEYAKTDDYIMRAARDELGLIMPSEIRYVNGN